jgi:sec-independent protein translocase protein TatB
MFDFAWSEIALIGVVALVLIGPKDMPVAIKAVSGMIKKARRMASEFQSHVDEMVRDTELAEVRQQLAEIRNMDIRGEIERTVDADGSLRRSLSDPLVTPPPPPPPVATPEAEAEFAYAPPPVALAEPPRAPAAEAADEGDAAPAFIPPEIARVREAPPFIPPEAAVSGGARPRLF